MGRTQYETIPHDEEDPLMGASSSTANSSSGTHHRGRSFWIGLLCVSAVSAAIFLGLSGPGSREQDSARLSQQDIPMEGATKARPCTFDECYASNCNQEYAPYTCLWHNGGPHGGCSAIEWVEGTCDDQCNLSDCASLAIPDDADSCKDVKCGDEWCSNPQLCPSDVSYQCTDGSARFGCSTDEYKWTFKSSGTTCPSCCDTTTCA